MSWREKSQINDIKNGCISFLSEIVWIPGYSQGYCGQGIYETVHWDSDVS